MISENLREVRQEIQKSCALVSRSEEDVTLFAVTKSVDAGATKAIVAAGVFHLAENRADKFLLKKQLFLDFPEIQWHFIGNLQRRKVNSLDNLKLAEEIQNRANKVLKCFVEVNVSGEESKQGISPEELADFIAKLAAYDKIKVVGLMTMAPAVATVPEQHQLFRRLRELRDEIHNQKLSWAPCTELSMGMSHDYQAAIQEGATFVRIGTVLFKE